MKTALRFTAELLSGALLLSCSAGTLPPVTVMNAAADAAYPEPDHQAAVF